MVPYMNGGRGKREREKGEGNIHVHVQHLVNVKRREGSG